jgi:coenzyme Q-binding protein COQ10
MPHFATNHRVSHSARQMFDLVADIETYPQFVPHCTGMVVTERTREDGRDVVTAKMTVSYGPVRETVTNRIVLDQGNLTISVRATQGPFKRLENEWSFEPDGEDACIVHFAIAYEFRSLALRLVTGTIAEGVFGNYSKAFEERADAIYGVPDAASG